MTDDRTYITYPDGSKIDIMEADQPLLLEQIVTVDGNSDTQMLKCEIKFKIDKLVNLCEEKRGPIKDGLVVISSGPNELEKVQGPVCENIEDKKNGKKYIRYARTVEFV